jgi:hypothetical protein
MPDDTQQARVAYLVHLRDEFHRYWPHGAVRSSEYTERQAFDAARDKIKKLEAKIEEDLL